MWKDEKFLVRCLRVLVCLVFLGRAWQHLRWDAPFRAILWKQRWLEPIISGWFDIPWREWVSLPAYDQGIQAGIQLMGLYFLVCAILALVSTREQKIGHWLLGLGSLLLFGLSFLYFVEKGFRIGQLIEYSLQFSAPLFLIRAIKGDLIGNQTRTWIKIAIALTFIGHGLYAAGIYPMPGDFVTMLMKGTGLNEDFARQLLVLAGYLDFIAAGLLFVPRLDRPALIYMAFWGFATALARLISYFDPASMISWLDGWLYESLFRLIHGGMPLILWLSLPHAVHDSSKQKTPTMALAT